MWKYTYWLIVGALAGLGIAALLTIGLLFLLLAGALALIGARTPALRNRSVLAVPAGVGLAVLYLAWLNRDGPGRVCHTTGATTSCADQWSPWPFIVVALLLAAVSVAWRDARGDCRGCAPRSDAPISEPAPCAPALALVGEQVEACEVVALAGESTVRAIEKRIADELRHLIEPARCAHLAHFHEIALRDGGAQIP